MKNRVLNLILVAIVVLLTSGFGVTLQDIQAKPHVRNLTKVEYCTLEAKAKGKSIDEVYKEVNAREASLQYKKTYLQKTLHQPIIINKLIEMVLLQLKIHL